MTRSLRAIFLACATALAGPQAQAAPAAFRPDYATLPAVPRHDLPAEAVRQAMARAEPSARPRRYAVAVATGIPLAEGRWDTAEPGIALWRLRLRSPGARSISALLAPLALPPGAQLWIYGSRATAAVFGPYDASRVSRQRFWTPLVAGDEMVLEVQVPSALSGALKLTVAQAFHGYEDWTKATGPGTSGSCNVDADCESGAWGAEARSVAMISVGNQWYCSGQLLNNVRQDRAPLFLTARHCGIDRERGPADSVNFYFNYGAPCGLPAPPEPDTVLSGSRLLADDVESDFALLRINGTPPPNAYFAGWNATGQGSASGASIHHPNGDEKKISLYETPVTQATVNIGVGCTLAAWEVRWVAGTTEGGSSGGGLWNASRQLIGVLSGGTASCDNPDGADYFGRLDLGWTAGPAPEQQLKAHLDPDGTCIAAIPGLDPTTNPTPGQISNGPSRCEGERSTCQVPGSGGGGSMSLAVLALLLAPLRQRRRRRL